jgi:hypothetical protein
MEMSDATIRVETTDPDPLPATGALAWAESVLRDQGMPHEEVLAVLGSEEAETIRRHLELHMERLEERYAGQRRRAASARRILTEVASAVL